jgi:hypothetical protein
MPCNSLEAKADSLRKKVRFKSVLRFRKYFSRIRVRVSLILKYGYGHRRPINYGSGSYRDILVATAKKYAEAN